MFEEFASERIEVEGVALRVRIGGSGPPLVLLHGYPQTSAMWLHVAPALAGDFTVICPDLRGYGESDRPAPAADNTTYSKRTMAAEIVALMRLLGHERFRLAGHDRGARVAYRLALDHPDAVDRLATLDIIPTLSTWEAMGWQGAIGAYHWPFLAQPGGLPERLINNDRAYYLRNTIARWARPGFVFDAEALAEYERCFDAECVAAICADYRAGATVDVEYDRADHGSKRIAAPLLALFGGGGRRDPVELEEVWREWARDVRVEVLDCGHFLAEEAGEETARRLGEFFREAR